MNLKPRGVAGALALLAAVFLAGPAMSAESYPNRPVRMIVGFPPGGATDILARIVGNKLLEAWGQNIIVDNRPSAQGSCCDKGGRQLGRRARGRFAERVVQVLTC